MRFPGKSAPAATASAGSSKHGNGKTFSFGVLATMLVCAAAFLGIGAPAAGAATSNSQTRRIGEVLSTDIADGAIAKALTYLSPWVPGTCLTQPPRGSLAEALAVYLSAPALPPLPEAPLQEPAE